MTKEFTVFDLIGREGIDWFVEQVKKEKTLSVGLLTDEAAAFLVWNKYRLKLENVKSILNKEVR